MSNVLSRDTVIVGGLAAGGGKVTYKSIPLTATGTTAETDTLFDLPPFAVLDQVPYVVVTAGASAAAVLHVGLLASESGGDADGFLASIPVTTTGVKTGTLTVSTSGAGSTGAAANFLASCTIGALLGTFDAGTTFLADTGSFAPKSHLSDSVTSKSVSWTLNSSTNTSFRANLVIPIKEFNA